MVFKLTVVGPPAIEAAFNDFAGNMIRYGLREPVDYLFQQAAQQARAESPVKTGFLRSSIGSERTAFGAALFARAHYALYVSNRNPYFTNAVEKIQRELPALVQRAISEQAGIMTRKFLGG